MSGSHFHRQKAIRVVTSALVCGLSFSFLVGEATNRQSKISSAWASDAHLLPKHFLPLAPLSASWNLFQNTAWQSNLVALNGGAVEVSSQEEVAEAAPTQLAPVASGVSAVTPTNIPLPDLIRSVSAAPLTLPREVKIAPKIETRAPAAMVVTAAKDDPKPALPGGPAFGPSPPIGFRETPVMSPRSKLMIASSTPKIPFLPAKVEVADTVSKADVQNILMALNEATVRGNGEPAKTQEHAMALAAVESQVREKTAPVEAKWVEVADAKGRPQRLAMIQAGVAKPEEILASKVEASSSTDDIGPAGEWKIHGRIAAPNGLEKGHFEIGLFSKIDQDGIPIGFPLVQQILPSGQHRFDLKVPGKLEKGFLYGEFVAGKTGKRSWIAPPLNPWLRTERQVAELTFQQEDAVTTAAAAPGAPEAHGDTLHISGTVGTLFAKPGSPIPQDEVLVKVRGRKESTRTAKDGSFHLDLPMAKGSINLEFVKGGYHPSVVEVPITADSFEVKVELASREAIDQVARALGMRQISSKGVFLGKAVNADGSGLKGLSIRSSQHADGPYYFGDDGFPSTARKNTSSDGRFLFFNLDSGPGYMESSINGEAVAPFQYSTVDGGEMVMKDLLPESGSIRGRIFNPVAAGNRMQPLSGARVRIEGAADYAVTDSYGAFTIGAVKWIKGERIFLEMSAEKFNNHRYSIHPGTQKGSLNFYAFPAVYIGRLAQSMDVDLDPYAGLVMGKVNGPAVRIDALADHSPINGAKDFYFDAKGKLRGSHTMTDPHFGTYVIFNVPKGRTLLEGSDAQGQLRYSEAVVSSPSSVSVIME